MANCPPRLQPMSSGSMEKVVGNVSVVSMVVMATSVRIALTAADPSTTASVRPVEVRPGARSHAVKVCARGEDCPTCWGSPTCWGCANPPGA